MVGTMCELLVATNATQTPGAAVIAAVHRYTGNNCLPIDYEAFVQKDSETELPTDENEPPLRVTTYLMCTQLGWFQTSESDEQPFGSRFPLRFYTELCERAFGADV